MLQKVLGAHPDVFTTSEPWLALAPLYALRPHGTRTEYSHGLAQQALRNFLQQLPEGEAVYFAAVRLMLEHLYGSALKVAGKQVFLDKTPRYHLIIDELQKVFPDAHFILLIRNPLAVLASTLDPSPQEPNVLRQFHADLLGAPRRLARALAHPNGRRQTVVRYEDFVKDPEGGAARLCAAVDLTPPPPGLVEYGASRAGQERWMLGDQGTVYRESRPVATRAGRWVDVLHRHADWTRLGHGYLKALGPELLGVLGYDAAELDAALGPDHDDGGALWRSVMEG